MSEINVFMYGGKSFFSKKETPLQVEITSCPLSNECSFFKEGTCLSVRNSFLDSQCKFSTTRTVKGYTSKAKKYYEFKNKWSNNDLLNVLDKAPKKLGLVADTVVLPYAHMVIILNEDGSIKMDYPYKSSKIQYLPLKNFTVDNIYKIVTNKPQALMGGTITSYQDEVVPKFLMDLKALMPSLYNEFIKKYKEFKEESINYVGRKAYLMTLKPGSIFNKDNESWEWDGKVLTMLNGPKPYFNIVKINYNVALHELVLEVNEKTTIEITDNNQVLDTTKFAD